MTAYAAIMSVIFVTMPIYTATLSDYMNIMGAYTATMSDFIIIIPIYTAIMSDYIIIMPIYIDKYSFTLCDDLTRLTDKAGWSTSLNRWRHSVRLQVGRSFDDRKGLVIARTIKVLAPIHQKRLPYYLRYTTSQNQQLLLRETGNENQ